jgi:hypothetical protein
VGYFEYYPHFGVLTGEVRSAAAWPGITKTDLIATTQALHKQYSLGWLVISSGEEVVGLLD